MTKEQINKLETEIETIVTNDAKQIIEGGYSTIADYLRDKQLVSKDAESLLALYNYLPFGDYIRYYYQTVCRFVDAQGNNEVIDLCETNDIIEDFEQRHDCICELLSADYLNNNETWVATLRDAEIHDYITGILRVTTERGTDYIALYNEMMR